MLTICRVFQKNSRYYPAEDIKPAKATYKVKQNVS